MRRRRPGASIVLREMWGGRVWSAWPAIVIEDGRERLIVFIPAGTTVKHAAGPDRRELRLYADEWTFTDRVTRRPVLSFTDPETEHSVMAFWDDRWRFGGWYVNLERALGRSNRTYDFVDHCLDVLIPPDRSTWTWKDEDELEEAVRRRTFTPEEAAAFRAEGERAALRVVHGEPPFDRDWSTWRPDPAWGTPELPEGWDSVRGKGVTTVHP
jgi:predicted RNA-binding protein associated with RNAse of E/G family